jgi:hypothetical protein
MTSAVDTALLNVQRMKGFDFTIFSDDTSVIISNKKIFDDFCATSNIYSVYSMLGLAAHPCVRTDRAPS